MGRLECSNCIRCGSATKVRWLTRRCLISAGSAASNLFVKGGVKSDNRGPCRKGSGLPHPEIEPAAHDYIAIEKICLGIALDAGNAAIGRNKISVGTHIRRRPKSGRPAFLLQCPKSNKT